MAAKIKKEDASIQAQRILLAYLLDRTNWFDRVSKVISPDDFIDDFYKKAAGIFWGQMESGEANPAQIMNYFTDENEHKKVAELFVSPIRSNLDLAEQEKAVNDAIYKIKKESLDQKAAMAKDIDELQNIIKQQNELQKIHVILN